MMKSTTSVNEALDQAVAAMNDGARPWTLGAAAARRIHDAYRIDFEHQLRRPHAWERESAKVLRLARWSGAVAALLAETDAGPEGHPGEIPADIALVATLAAQHACPIPVPRGGQSFVAGRWCGPDLDVPAELRAKAATLFTLD
jgi:hypothetical protein